MKDGLIRELFAGPIDIVGDIHGEIDALWDLLKQLGYDEDGVHPDSRRLVFIGDLTDRGPDSPAVIDVVSGLVSRELAQCVLGNHELNLLRDEDKEGNGWYFDDNHDHKEGKFRDCRSLDAVKRPGVRAFLSGLPIALERTDLRLVHAAWHGPSIDDIRSSPLSAVELYKLYHRRAVQLGTDTGLASRAKIEKQSIGDRLKDRDAVVPILSALSSLDVLYQDINPIRIATSGLERVAQEAFFASGKWRMVDRYLWWKDYQDDVPVIVDHYWRWPTVSARERYSRGEADLFKENAAHHWLGAKHNVFCVDFAVGARHKERAEGTTDQFECRLAAVRWPEQQLVFDVGKMLAMTEE